MREGHTYALSKQVAMIMFIDRTYVCENSCSPLLLFIFFPGDWKFSMVLRVIGVSGIVHAGMGVYVGVVAAGMVARTGAVAGVSSSLFSKLQMRRQQEERNIAVKLMLGTWRLDRVQIKDICLVELSEICKLLNNDESGAWTPQSLFIC